MGVHIEAEASTVSNLPTHHASDLCLSSFPYFYVGISAAFLDGFNMVPLILGMPTADISRITKRTRNNASAHFCTFFKLPGKLSNIRESNFEIPCSLHQAFRTSDQRI